MRILLLLNKQSMLMRTVDIEEQTNEYINDYHVARA